jgi:hypothetical protein
MAFLLIGFLFLFSMPVSALQIDETCVQDAQTWYDSLVPSGRLTRLWNNAMFGLDNAKKQAAIDDMQTILDGAGNLDYPDCIVYPHQWYLRAIQYSIDAATSRLAGDPEAEDKATTERSANMGAFHGFMLALGLDMESSEDELDTYK